MEPKKTSIIRILQVLEKYSDYKHPLTQADIIEKLRNDWDLECERKAVSRNISILKEMDYDIVSTKTGSYLASKDFETSELRMLIDSVINSRYINKTHTKDLINKLVKLGGLNFRNHVKHVYAEKQSGRSNNQDFFFNVEVLDEAIEKGHQVKFFYNKYGIDKKLHKSSDEKRTVNPYQLIVHNQKYYLAGNYDNYNNLLFLHLERITDIEVTDTPIKPLKSLPDWKDGVDWSELTTRLPYLYPETPQRIELICKTNLIDELIDWFGDDFIVTKIDDENIKVSLIASTQAMEYWFLQYGKSAEVVSPAPLRDKIIEDIKTMCNSYGLELK